MALITGATIALSACTSTTNGTASSSKTSGSGSSTTASSSNATTSTPTPTKSAKPATVIKVSSLEDDGTTWGVGMPVVLYFSKAPTDSTAFTKAVTVTVNGQPAGGAWFWEKPYADQPIQAHYRLRSYWPANSTVEVKLPIGGLSAGTGLVYSGALSSVTFHIGDAHVSTVNAGDLQMTVTDNGKMVRTFPVSLGKASTPTYNGTKVVMQKGEDLPGTNTRRPKGAVRMVGPGYDELVEWSVRMTASGEYVHYAPWNNRIGGTSTSNGCTNVGQADSVWFYNFSQVGDVVTYQGTDGKRMPSWDGFGDWNIPWILWAKGGLLINH